MKLQNEREREGVREMREKIRKLQLESLSINSMNKYENRSFHIENK